MLEKQVKQLQKDAALRNAPLRMVEILQEENADLKKSFAWYQEENLALKLKTQTKKATVS